MDAIMVEILELSAIADVNDCFNAINKLMTENPHDRLYLFIHNIDGPTLVSHKAQDFLSRLASIPNVHMIASVDHTNASIRKFNFYKT